MRVYHQIYPVIDHPELPEEADMLSEGGPVAVLEREEEEEDER